MRFAKSARAAKRRPPTGRMAARANGGKRQMIRAVLFDYGGVIGFHPEEQQYAEAARDSGLSAENFILAFWLHRIPYDAGEVTPDENWRGVLTSARDNFDPARVPGMIQHDTAF